MYLNLFCKMCFIDKDSNLPSTIFTRVVRKKMLKSY